MGAVNRQAQQFAIALGELIGMSGKGDKFGRANRGEISRLGKQNQGQDLLICRHSPTGL